MALKTAVLALTAAQAVAAHFGLVYPEWRADTLSAEAESKYSQWDYPCGGVPYRAGNITDWPSSGGSLQLSLHHPWTYVFVNLGLGPNTTNFNISLTPEFLNVTGKGTLCIDRLALPPASVLGTGTGAGSAAVRNGSLASLQVVTVGETGSALYNCADIRFSDDARPLDNCSSSEGVVVQAIREQQSGGNGTGEGGGAGATNAAAGLLSADKVALTTVVGLATAFALGIGI